MHAWSAIKRFLYYKLPLSILYSLVENSGMCPKWAHIFLSWKQAGVNHKYDLFYKGECVTLDKISSNFHIVQKDLYKYLQVRQYVIWWTLH